jgi:hypothetical protein
MREYPKIMITRLKTGCKQYNFKDIDEAQKYFSKKCYLGEVLRIMYFDENTRKKTKDYYVLNDWEQPYFSLEYDALLFYTPTAFKDFPFQ